MAKGASLDTVLASLDTVLATVVSLSERVDVIPTMVKSMIEDAKEELLGEMRPIARAVDTDAVNLVDHERRIRKIEHKIILK